MTINLVSKRSYWLTSAVFWVRQLNISSLSQRGALESPFLVDSLLDAQEMLKLQVDAQEMLKY